LDGIIKLYHDKLSQVSIGLNFYTDFNVKLKELYLQIKEFIAKRNIEKDEVLRIASGGLYGKRKTIINI